VLFPSDVFIDDDALDALFNAAQPDRVPEL